MRISTLLLFAVLFFQSLWAKENYDFPPVSELSEMKKMPDPWQFFNSDRRVSSDEEWQERRVELKKMFEFYEYGQDFPRPDNTIGTITQKSTRYNGKADFYDADLSMGPNYSVQGTLRDIVPTAGEVPYPAILYAVYTPNENPLAMPWMEQVIDRGYIVAEWYCREYDDYRSGPHPDPGPVQEAYPDYDGAVLMAWSWGARAMVTYLSSLDVVDTNTIILVGNSRRGKTALLTGAFDERIDLIVSSCSGCMGFPVFRYSGEGACRRAIQPAGTFPGWSNDTFKDFAGGNEDRLPIDQHFLAALIAPRAILVNEGSRDSLANQEGSQESYLAAKEVYKWLGVGENIGWYENENSGHGYFGCQKMHSGSGGLIGR